MIKLNGSLDVARFESVVTRGNEAELMALRAELNERKKIVESQLADDTTGLREERAEMIARGMHPREADLRASAGGDPDWRNRAAGYVRICDVWLGKIRARMAEKTAGPTSYAAVVIAGGGRSAKAVAESLNMLIRRGCKISNSVVVDGDLVVVASEPKEAVPLRATLSERASGGTK